MKKSKGRRVQQMKMKKPSMVRKVMGMVFSMMFLSSCAYLPIDELMQAPKLTDEQSAIYEALEKAVGSPDLQLKYPKSGKHRSAFLLYDLDDDGEDEAVAFYQTSNSDRTRINVLDKAPNHVWYSRDDWAGEGSDVDFVEFLEMEESDTLYMIIGWENRLEEINQVTISSYENHILTEEFSEDYSNIVIEDVNDDGMEEIVLLLYGRSYGNADAMLVGQTDDGLGVLSQYHLNDNITAINQVLVGETADGESAIFIDETTKTHYTTEVLTVDDEKLVPILADYHFTPEEESVAEKASIQVLSPNRSQPILSEDIDLDGIIEIPTSRMFGGYATSNSSNEIIYETIYYEVEGGFLDNPVHYAVNQVNGYRIKLPEKWIDTVTIVKQEETGEWRFIPYESGEIDVDAIPLLRILVYSKDDYRDKFNIGNFDLLIQKRLFEYYYAIPDPTHPLAITETELKQLFELIN